MVRASLKWIFLILGTTIGAGYASGRELWQFFGHGSGLAILLFTILFSFCCMVIMELSFKHRSSNYFPVLHEIVGPRIAPFYDAMIFVYLFTTTVVMIAGSGATGQAFQISYWWGIIFTVFALVLLFIRDIQGLLSVNQIIMPILIGGLIFILLLFIRDQELSLFSHLHEQHNWLAAFPFTSLNILPLVAVLGAIGNQVKTKAEIIAASFGSGVILGVLTFIYNNSLIRIADDILIYEIPLFAILKHYPFEILLFMSIMLWFAIFTTAASGLLGMATRIRPWINKPLIIIVIILIVLMIPLTTIGFSTLIKFLYPLYGMLNLYVLTRLILYPWWREK